MLRHISHQRHHHFRKTMIFISLTQHPYPRSHAISHAQMHPPLIPYQDNQTPNLFLNLNRTLDSRQERLGVRTHDFLDLLLVLEDQEGGHGADAELLRNFRDVVDIELDEVGVGEVIGEPDSLPLAR